MTSVTEGEGDMAEPLDTVASEVHQFSKEEVLDSERGALSETADAEPIEDVVSVAGQESKAHEDEEFECLLGAHGQVVLWCSRRETVLSRFDFVLPEQLAGQVVGQECAVVAPVLDCDGDLQVTRKKDLNKKEAVLLIEHQSATTLDLVGEQVWRGALFLADYLLHQPHILTNAHVLEVAAGVGLTSLVAAMLARRVTVTDIDRGDILELIHRNIKRNTDLIKADMEVKEIDFFNHVSIDDLADLTKDVSVLLAADVIYHNQLTDAFFSTVLRLMSDPPQKTMYVALEKRYVFTMEDMDTMAPCYEYFLQKMEWLRCQNLSHIDWTVEQLHSDFEQYFTYERTRHLVLWKIEAKLK